MVISIKLHQIMSNVVYVAERSEIGCCVRCEVSSDMNGEISLVKNELGIRNF